MNFTPQTFDRYHGGLSGIPDLFDVHSKCNVHCCEGVSLASFSGQSRYTIFAGIKTLAKFKLVLFTIYNSSRFKCVSLYRDAIGTGLVIFSIFVYFRKLRTLMVRGISFGGRTNIILFEHLLASHIINKY